MKPAPTYKPISSAASLFSIGHACPILPLTWPSAAPTFWLSNAQARAEARASHELIAEALAEIRTLAIRQAEALTDSGTHELFALTRAEICVSQEFIAEVLAAIRAFEFVSSPGLAAAAQDALTDVQTEVRASRELIAQVLTELRATADSGGTIPDDALQEAIAQARAEIRVLQDMIVLLREQLDNRAPRLPDWLRRPSWAALFGRENGPTPFGFGQTTSAPV